MAILVHTTPVELLVSRTDGLRTHLGFHAEPASLLEEPGIFTLRDGKTGHSGVGRVPVQGGGKSLNICEMER